MAFRSVVVWNTTKRQTEIITSTDLSTIGSGLNFKQVAAPAAPSLGFDILYFKNDDLLYRKDTLGNEYQITDSSTPSLWTDGTTYLKPTANGRGLRTYDSGGTKYLSLSNDGTNSLIQSYGADLKITGSDAVGGNLKLYSSSNGTKGKIYLGTSTWYDETNSRFGIGCSPEQQLSVNGFLNVDQSNSDTGGEGRWTYHAITFGSTSSEGIGSKRSDGGVAPWGLCFYTDWSRRMFITNNGKIAIGGPFYGDPVCGAEIRSNFAGAGGTLAIHNWNAAGDASIDFYCNNTAKASTFYQASTGYLVLSNAGNGTQIATSASHKIGFWNATPVVQDTGWLISNKVSTKVIDFSDADLTLEDIGNVLGTLVDTDKSYGLLGA